MNAQQWTGIVARKNGKSIHVETMEIRKHRYGKHIRLKSLFAAHDEMGCCIGDKVVIMNCPKISKTKSKIVVSKGCVHGGGK